MIIEMYTSFQLIKIRKIEENYNTLSIFGIFLVYISSYF